MLVVETDGVMVRYLNGWHEVKLGLFAQGTQAALSVPSRFASPLPTAC